jgi:hypothetical protein
MSRSRRYVIPYFDFVESLSSFSRVKIMDTVALYKCSDFKNKYLLVHWLQFALSHLVKTLHILLKMQSSF